MYLVIYQVDLLNSEHWRTLKNWKTLKITTVFHKTLKLIALLYLYLIFNSLISQDFLIGANRNFGFIRFGLLFLAFNYFFFNKDFVNKVLIIWMITLSIVSLDTYIERIYGTNILGYGEGDRIFSFSRGVPIL